MGRFWSVVAMTGEVYRRAGYLCIRYKRAIAIEGSRVGPLKGRWRFGDGRNKTGGSMVDEPRCAVPVSFHDACFIGSGEICDGGGTSAECVRGEPAASSEQTGSRT